MSVAVWKRESIRSDWRIVVSWSWTAADAVALKTRRSGSWRALPGQELRPVAVWKPIGVPLLAGILRGV
jgi:hypothetical protein